MSAEHIVQFTTAIDVASTALGTLVERCKGMQQRLPGTTALYIDPQIITAAEEAMAVLQTPVAVLAEVHEVPDYRGLLEEAVALMKGLDVDPIRGERVKVTYSQWLGFLERSKAALSSDADSTEIGA